MTYKQIQEMKQWDEAYKKSHASIDMSSSFSCFNLRHNSKLPSGEYAKARLAHEKRPITLGCLKELFETGFCQNKGVLTGKANDIVVVDLDFYDHGDEHFNTQLSPFYTTFGVNFVESFNTFTIKTGSGGYHLYFK